MSVWAIIGTVIGSLILLVLLILLVPVGLSVRPDRDGAAILRLHVLFLRFRLYPEKEENSRKKARKERKKRKKAAKKGSDKPEKEPSLGDKIKKARGTLDTVKEFSSLIRIALQKLKKLLGKCTVKRFRVRLIAGDGGDSANAALTYGAACAVIYPLSAMLKNTLHFRRGAEKLELGCDFEREKTELRLDFYISIRIIHIVSAALGVLTAYLHKDRGGKTNG